MLIANNIEGKKILARDIIKINFNEYFCPECDEIVILKKGQIKIAHFAHHKNSECNSAGESLRHMELKQKLYDYLKQISNFNIQMEYFFNYYGLKRRSDIYFNNIHIEIQCSPIIYEKLCYRTVENTFWLFDENNFCNFTRTKYGLSIKLKHPLIEMVNKKENIYFINSDMFIWEFYDFEKQNYKKTCYFGKRKEIKDLGAYLINKFKQ